MAAPEGSLRFAILGAGSWGTALAVHLAGNGTPVVLWGRKAAQVAALQKARENREYLPGVFFPENLELNADLAAAAGGADIVLLACPSHAFTELLRAARPHLPEAAHLAWASKGFEPGSGRLLHQVADDLLDRQRPKAVVTGPSFAAEVARGLPTALTVASADAHCARGIACALHSGNFRAYTSTDIVGAEFGGAAKNVYAIATGIADGMALGANARAALITRGLHEMMRLSAALGAAPETLIGLTGLGDLVLTCTGDLSRNHRFGQALGQERDFDASLAEIHQVVEGIGATREVCRLAEQHGVDTPIAAQVLRILEHGVAPREGLRALLAREQKDEYC